MEGILPIRAERLQHSDRVILATQSASITWRRVDVKVAVSSDDNDAYADDTRVNVLPVTWLMLDDD